VADRIPDGITREHLLEAIRALDAGEPHPFGPSTGYDVLHAGKRYPPKAVVGIGLDVVEQAVGQRRLRYQ
jgi:hypothetical protein